MSEKYTETERELIMLILDASENCSPTKLSINHTTETGQVRKGIVITEACGAIIDKIVKSPLVMTTYLTPKGLHVTCHQKGERKSVGCI